MFVIYGTDTSIPDKFVNSRRDTIAHFCKHSFASRLPVAFGLVSVMQDSRASTSCGIKFLPLPCPHVFNVCFIQVEHHHTYTTRG
jgi:hypothetical protein